MPRSIQVGVPSGWFSVTTLITRSSRSGSLGRSTNAGRWSIRPSCVRLESPIPPRRRWRTSAGSWPGAVSRCWRAAWSPGSRWSARPATVQGRCSGRHPVGVAARESGRSQPRPETARLPRSPGPARSPGPRSGRPAGPTAAVAGCGQTGAMRVAVVVDADGGGLLQAVADDGTPQGPAGAGRDLAAAVGERERAERPRWVWAATARCTRGCCGPGSGSSAATTWP